jgi:hypothetical protein
VIQKRSVFFTIQPYTVTNKKQTVFRYGEEHYTDTYNATPVCLVHCTHLTTQTLARQNRNERSKSWNAVLWNANRHSSVHTSSHLIACRTTALRKATRSAARLARHVGSTVSCGEWEERKRWEVGENVGIFVLKAAMQKEVVLAFRLADQFNSLKYLPPSKSSEIFLLFLNNLYIKYCY